MAASASLSASTTASASATGRWCELISADGTAVAAYVAEPQGPVRGAIVVLQEIFGVNAHIRQVADGYAALGWRVIAPATFQRVQAGVELGYSGADMGQGMALKAAVEALPAPGVLADIQAAIDEAARGSDGAGAVVKVGIVGFCWGGLLSWRAACELRGLSAAVTYYGGGMTVPPEVVRRPRVPVLAHFGEHDEYITPESIDAFAAMHTEVEVHRYAAHHGFNCDHRGAYDAAASARARERTVAFFDRHLSP